MSMNEDQKRLMIDKLLDVATAANSLINLVRLGELDASSIMANRMQHDATSVAGMLDVFTEGRHSDRP